ncbi:unnamed protein product [Ectocarpus sp. 12 AP-2014]
MVTYTATSVVVSASKHVNDPVSSSKEPSFHKPDPAPSSTAADPNDGDGDKNVPTHDAVPTSTVTSSVHFHLRALRRIARKLNEKKHAAVLMIAELVHRAGDNPSAGDVVQRARERHNLRASVHNGDHTEGDDEGKDAWPIPESISGAAAENQAPTQKEDSNDERDPKSDGSDDGNNSSSNSNNGNGTSNDSSSHDDNMKKRRPVLFFSEAFFHTNHTQKSSVAGCACMSPRSIVRCSTRALFFLVQSAVVLLCTTTYGPVLRVCVRRYGGRDG